MDDHQEVGSAIQIVRSDVLRSLGLLRIFSQYWGPPASAAEIEAYKTKAFPLLHESLVDLWTQVNGLSVADLLVYAAPIADDAPFKLDPTYSIVDPNWFFQRDFRFIERGYVPVSEDGLGNYYVADTHHQNGLLLPIIFIDHEAEYEPEYVAASNLWTFLRFQIGERIGELKPEIVELRPELKKLMGHSPGSWPFDKEYILQYDQWLLDLQIDVAMMWEDE